MPEDRPPRKRPTEIAIEIVESFVANPLGSPLDVPSGLRWSLKSRIADAIRRERVIIFQLRDAAREAAEMVGRVLDASTQAALERRLREAVEASLTDEDLELPRFDANRFEHAPSARLALLEVHELTPGRLTFEFEDTYTGKGYFLTFDFPTEILCHSKTEGASLQQLGAMFAAAAAEFAKRRGDVNPAKEGA